MVVNRVEEPIRVRVGIVHADLGDVVAEGREKALELATYQKRLVDGKRLGSDRRARRRQRLATGRRLEQHAGGDARRLLARSITATERHILYLVRYKAIEQSRSRLRSSSFDAVSRDCSSCWIRYLVNWQRISAQRVEGWNWRRLKELRKQSLGSIIIVRRDCIIRVGGRIRR